VRKRGDSELFRVNVVNVGEHYKRVTFITYPHESKGLVNVVNVSSEYLV